MDGEKDSVYFCGNSLGLQPKEAQTLVLQEMEKWQQMYEDDWNYTTFNYLISEILFINLHLVFWQFSSVSQK